MNKHKSALWGVSIALVIALAIPLTAYAVHVTINTNDGLVDPNWASVTLFSADGDDWPDNNYDIDQAWVTNEADNSFFYFRANLVGAGQLPVDNWSSLEAHLDCDQDGNDYGPADVIAIYLANAEGISGECQGPDWPDCYSGDWNNLTTGEAIPGTPYNYEWLGDVNNGNVDWSACLDTVDIRFVTLDINLDVADVATVREYDVPTVVTLEKVGASQPGATSPLAAASLFVGAVTLAGLGLMRRRARQDS